MKYSPVPNSYWPISCEYQSEADDKYTYPTLCHKRCRFYPEIGSIRKAPRSVWVKPWLLRRPLQGHYENLLQKLNGEDLGEYQNVIWVPPELFVEILHRVWPRIQKQHTNWRPPLDPGIKNCHHFEVFSNRKYLQNFILWIQSGKQYNFIIHTWNLWSYYSGVQIQGQLPGKMIWSRLE